MPCENFCLKKNEVKYDLTRIFKNETTSDDMDKMVYNWLVSFEKFNKQYIIMPSLLLNPLLIVEFFSSQFNHPLVSIIKKTKQYVI